MYKYEHSPACLRPSRELSRYLTAQQHVRISIDNAFENRLRSSPTKSLREFVWRPPSLCGKGIRKKNPKFIL